jgi:hypothetical protein
MIIGRHTFLEAKWKTSLTLFEIFDPWFAQSIFQIWR